MLVCMRERLQGLEPRLQDRTDDDDRPPSPYGRICLVPQEPVRQVRPVRQCRQGTTETGVGGVTGFPSDFVERQTTIRPYKQQGIKMLRLGELEQSFRGVGWMSPSQEVQDRPPLGQMRVLLR